MYKPLPARAGHRRTISAFETVTRASREAVLVVHAATERIAASNAATERLFGYFAAQLVGRTSESLHAAADSYGRLHTAITEAVHQGSVAATSSTLRRRDGSLIAARSRIVGVDTPTGRHSVMWLVRRADESNMSVRNEILERDLFRIAVAEAGAAEDMWRVVLERLRHEFDWDYAEAWSPDNGRLRQTAWRAPVATPELQRFAEITEGIDFGPAEGLPGRAWRSGDSEWLSDVTEHPESVFRRTFIARSAGLTTFFAVPVRAFDRVKHVLVFASRLSREADQNIAALTVDACRAIAQLAAAQDVEAHRS